MNASTRPLPLCRRPANCLHLCHAPDPAQPVAAYGRHRVLSSVAVTGWLKRGGIALVLAGDTDTTFTPEGAASRSSPSRLEDGSPYWWALVAAYADWLDIDPYFVAAVLLAESGGDPSAVGDHGHSVGLMQLHDRGFGAGLGDARYDPALSIWHGTQALGAGVKAYGTLKEAYSRYYNPGGEVQSQYLMSWYNRLQSLGRGSAGAHAGAR